MVQLTSIGFILGAILLSGVTGLAQSPVPHTGDSQFGDTTLFDNGVWAISGGSDTGPNPRAIQVSVDGQFAGDFSELKVFHLIPNLGFPQIFSVKGNGALRPALPTGEFGGTFYTTGYWDSDSGFIQTMPIVGLNIQLRPTDSTFLQFLGQISNMCSLEASDFTLNVYPPSLDSFRVDVSYHLVASSDFGVDITRQAQHEGFRIARIVSNFISEDVHDSDQASYTDTTGNEIRTDLVNESGFVFADHMSLLPMGEPELYLTHSDSLPRNTPALILRFSEPPVEDITPQGFVTYTVDPADDNVDLWGNWDRAGTTYGAADTVGGFSYTLLAHPPEPVTEVTGESDIDPHPFDHSLAPNYPNPFNPSTTIKYRLGEVVDVKVTIHNILGQRVRNLINGRQPGGSYRVRWDGKNNTGVQLSSGIYFLQLSAGASLQTRKMVLLR